MTAARTTDGGDRARPPARHQRPRARAHRAAAVHRAGLRRHDGRADRRRGRGQPAHVLPLLRQPRPTCCGASSTTRSTRCGRRSAGVPADVPMMDAIRQVVVSVNHYRAEDVAELRDPDQPDQQRAGAAGECGRPLRRLGAGRQRRSPRTRRGEPADALVPARDRPGDAGRLPGRLRRVGRRAPTPTSPLPRRRAGRPAVRIRRARRGGYGPSDMITTARPSSSPRRSLS